jgi:DNA-binding response OmpR family regulator
MVKRILLAHSRFQRTDIIPQWKEYFQRFGYELEIISSAGSIEQLLRTEPYDLLIVGSRLGSVDYLEVIDSVREVSSRTRIVVYSNVSVDTKALGVGRLSDNKTLPQVLGYVRACFAPRPSPTKKK